MIDILSGAILDDMQKRVIDKIRPFTDADGVVLTVTRGHDTPRNQLDMIERKARENNCLYSEFQPGNLYDQTIVKRDGREYAAYLWAQTLSALLLKGFVINPPLTFTCLEHYIRPTSEDMYLKVMDPSPHIKDVPTPEQIKKGEYVPCPIDFSARVDRLLPTERVSIDLVVALMNEAKRSMDAEREARKAGLKQDESDRWIGIRFVKPEPKNVCVHIDLEKEQSGGTA